MYGYIHKGNSCVSFYIHVEGYPETGYLYYSLRDAIRKYRIDNGLRYKHIDFIDLI